MQRGERYQDEGQGSNVGWEAGQAQHEGKQDKKRPEVSCGAEEDGHRAGRLTCDPVPFTPAHLSTCCRMLRNCASVQIGQAWTAAMNGVDVREEPAASARKDVLRHTLLMPRAASLMQPSPNSLEPPHSHGEDIPCRAGGRSPPSARGDPQSILSHSVRDPLVPLFLVISRPSRHFSWPSLPRCPGNKVR